MQLDMFFRGPPIRRTGLMLNHSHAKNYGSALGYDPTLSYGSTLAMILP